jgi:mannose-6-phosphate isomerase-like protein (cupin superfamily)
MGERPTDGRLVTVLECADLDAMVAFLTRELGLRIDTISPADSPATITLSGFGASIRVERGEDVAGRFAFAVPADRAGNTLIAPNGTRIDLVADGGDYVLPDGAPSLSIVRAPVLDDDGFGVGRAGMEYRDLLPDRWGGRFIASHIRIPGGGEVADSVHFHRIRFQLIFCARGWVDLVYEDQGAPFRLEAGDCVVQPPEIRHRVLCASEGLEVIEIGCPAVHDTFIEHEMVLPTDVVDPDRSFGGQRFVRDAAAQAAWRPWLVDGLRSRRTGVADATDSLAGVRVIGVAGPPPAVPTWLHHDGEFVFDVVLHGRAVLRVDDGTGERVEHLGTRDALATPPGSRWQWSDWSDDFELLEVTLPADPIAVDPST